MENQTKNPMTLYFLSGSIHSAKAKDLVEESGLEIKVVDASSRELMTALFVDLNIRELPCLTGNYQIYTGLDAIKNYLSSVH